MKLLSRHSLALFNLLVSLLSAYQATAQTPTWNTTGAHGKARSLHTATLLTNGKMLVVGGFQSCAPQCRATNTAELYDPATGQ